MSPFRPARPPAGRLARLGIVLDAGEGSIPLARLCDRAGIDVVWLADRGRIATSGGAATGAWVEAVARSLERASLGLLLGTEDTVESIVVTPALVDLRASGRLELAWPPGAIPILAGSTAAVRRSVVLGDLSDLAPTLAVADDVVLPAWRFGDLETATDEVRAEAAEAGRDPSSLGVAALVPVSIGRTQAEADARVAADPLFLEIGDPSAVGVFGTLEECQDRVIALAHAGVTDLRCLIPATLDAHDVIAQLTAMTIGTTDVLIPGSLRSPSPPPPDGWGGRPPVPPTTRVSGGSRRR